MIAYYLTDVDRAAVKVGKSLVKLTIKNGSPGILELKNDDENSYQKGAMPRFAIEEIQISPSTVAFTLEVAGAFDGTNYDKLIADVIDTGLNGKVSRTVFNPLYVCQYPLKLTISTTLAVDTIVYLHLVIREAYQAVA